MAYDEYLGERIARILDDQNVEYLPKKMMGGLCFMIDDKMCIGVAKNELMARVGEEAYEESLTKKGAKEMNFTGRPMKGFVFIDPDGTDMDEDLEYWVKKCLVFNPFAKSRKKKK